MKTIAQQLRVKEFPFIMGDSKGREIYYEDLNRFWRKTEYDSEGNEIYYENSDGFWIKRRFNSQGDMIYIENSNGFWIKREFDSNRNRIYYEDSNGNIKDNRSIPEYTMEELVDKLGNFKLKK